MQDSADKISEQAEALSQVDIGEFIPLSSTGCSEIYAFLVQSMGIWINIISILWHDEINFGAHLNGPFRYKVVGLERVNNADHESLKRQ